jgi:4'-phosphopantetheinyl transferase EntD
VFCAKEAAFKAQSPLSRALFGFHGFQVAFTTAPKGSSEGSPGGTAFAARFTAAHPPFARGRVLRGRLLRAEGHLLTVVAF